MIVFKANSIDEMANKVYIGLKLNGKVADSRNGRVLEFPEPITMVYTHPERRCSFVKGRNANAVFHHMEALWLLAGRNDTEFLDMFNSNMKKYSDDGGTFNAAYGYRLRHHFGIDQIKEVVNILKENPNSRQAVLQIWTQKDLTKDTRDKACNMMAVASITDGIVNLIVYTRSNDLIYGGVTGTNPVQFSYILQHLCEELKRPMGELTFVVTNAHVYLDLYPHWHNMTFGMKATVWHTNNLQLGGLVEIEEFCDIVVKKEIIDIVFESQTLNYISKPMANFWIARKYKGEGNVIQQLYVDRIQSTDWRMAITDWMIK